MNRLDYAFPFRIDATSRQAALVPYDKHVEQMVRQILLTSPGERADFPEFGCGVRQLLFAPHSDALDTTAKLLITSALNEWLASQIAVRDVKVGRPGDGPDASQLLIQVEYELIETRMTQRVEVLVF
jgi:phage baseplate assembly protein W